MMDIIRPHAFDCLGLFCSTKSLVELSGRRWRALARTHADRATHEEGIGIGPMNGSSASGFPVCSLSVSSLPLTCWCASLRSPFQMGIRCENLSYLLIMSCPWGSLTHTWNKFHLHVLKDARTFMTYPAVLVGVRQYKRLLLPRKWDKQIHVCGLEGLNYLVCWNTSLFMRHKFIWLDRETFFS